MQNVQIGGRQFSNAGVRSDHGQPDQTCTLDAVRWGLRFPAADVTTPANRRRRLLQSERLPILHPQLQHPRSLSMLPRFRKLHQYNKHLPPLHS